MAEGKENMRNHELALKAPAQKSHMALSLLFRGPELIVGANLTSTGWEVDPFLCKS